LNISPDQGADFQKQAERVWTKWASNCDARGKLTFAEIEFLAVRQILEAGEFLSIRRAINDDRPYFLALDIMEPDRLDDPPDKRDDPNTRFGITSNDRGRPLTYHIRETHPGDSFRKRDDAYKFTAVKAQDGGGRPNVFHVFPVLRPGQTRGIPFFAPVIEKFKMLADYLEAELVAARVAACFAAFVKTENPYGAATANAATTENDQRLEALEPGVIEYLGMNQDVTFAKPERPGTTFDQFVQRILRMIGAALGLPYELVLKDFSQTNYSSARAALLQAYRVFQVWQNMIVNHLCQPVYELLLEEAWLRGELTAPGFESQKWEYTRAGWIPPGWRWVDPLKEANADKISIEMGLKTRADSCAEQGQDWEEKAEQAAREKAKYEELGLPWEGMSQGGGGGQQEDATPEEK
jgi:lambda family phage portal protein